MPDYIEAVLKESMRKYSIVALGSYRYMKNETGSDLHLIDDIGQTIEYHLPKGTYVFVSIHCLHNSTRNWGPNAMKFDPNRWLTDDYTSKFNEYNEMKSQNKETNPLSSLAAYGGIGKKKDELCFAPFSFGLRNCLGMNLALMEIKATIKDLVTNYSFELAEESMKDELNVMESHVTLRPRNKLPIIVTLRNKMQ